MRRLLRGRPMEPLLVKAVQDLDLAPDCIAALRKLALRKQKDAAAAIDRVRRQADCGRPAVESTEDDGRL
mgnify:CR=1 FL=1